MRIEGGAAGKRTGNLETKFRAPPLASLPSRLAPRTHDPPTHKRLTCQALACAMSGSSSVTAMKKVVQQLRLEAGLNRVKVSGGGRPRGRGRYPAVELAGAGGTRFPWGGRALGGRDPGAANLRDVVARVGVVVRGAGSCALPPQNFPKRAGPWTEERLSAFRPSSLAPSLPSDFAAGLATSRARSAPFYQPPLFLVAG